MIVEDGKIAIARLISNSFEKMQVGDGADDTSIRQKGLDHAITNKVNASSITVIGSQIIYEVTLSGSDINGINVSEMGIFSAEDAIAASGDASSVDRTLINDKLLSRINFNSVGPIAANDTITFTFVMEVE